MSNSAPATRPPDPWSVITTTPDDTVRLLAKGLEARGNEPQYRALINSWFDMIVPKAISGKQEIVIAEIGCGSGSLTRQLARRLPADLVKQGKAKIVGVDPSPMLLTVADELVKSEADAAELLPRIEWRVGTAEEPNIKDVDLAICVTVFSHLSNPQPALDGLFSCLKPGGVVAIFDQDYTTLISHGPGNFNPLFAKVNLGNSQYRVSAGDVGRRLYSFLHSHPLASRASVVAKSFTYSENGTSGYLANLLDRAAQTAVQCGLMTGDEKEEWSRLAREQQESGDWFAALMYVGAWAERAGGDEKL